MWVSDIQDPQAKKVFLLGTCMCEWKHPVHTWAFVTVPVKQSFSKNIHLCIHYVHNTLEHDQKTAIKKRPGLSYGNMKNNNIFLFTTTLKKIF